jgi:hypothetical protein
LPVKYFHIHHPKHPPKWKQVPHPPFKMTASICSKTVSTHMHSIFILLIHFSLRMNVAPPQFSFPHYPKQGI